MSKLDLHLQVGHLVAEAPARSRVFERHRIDYCCGGKRTLEEACRDEGLDTDTVIADLEALDSHTQADEVNVLDMTMTELADHIEQTHHLYLRSELPRLEALIDKVTSAHSETYPWLKDLKVTFADLMAELQPHMLKEEQILFPMIRELDRATSAPAFHCGNVNNPIHVMEQEHDNAGRGLGLLRELTSDFAPPETACNSFRAMLDGLATLETDMHEHIHKENNVLFVNASEKDITLRSSNSHTA